MTEPQKILVIMLRRIGDVLLTTPAVRALRKRYPKARIDFLVEPPCHEALEGNPDVSNILTYRGGWAGLAWFWRLRKERYDWVVDYLGNPRSAALSRATGAAVRAGPAHVAHRWAYTHPLRESEAPCYSALEKMRVLTQLGVAIDDADCMPRWESSPAAEAWAAERLESLGVGAGDALIGFIPASRRETRRWPASHYAELGRKLRKETGAKVLVFWGPGEKELAEDVARGIGEGGLLSPLTPNLKSLAALLGRCRLVVTNCNGPKHIAASRGVPTLTLHGSSDPVCWNPPDPARHPVARLETLHCIGCRRNACPYGLECMKDLKPEAVFLPAKELLQEVK